MVQIINNPLCLDCCIKLEQVDELMERLQGLNAKFSLLLACTECAKKRLFKDNLYDNDDNEDDYNESQSICEQNLIKSNEIVSSPNITEHLKIETILSDCEPDYNDYEILHSPKSEPETKKVKKLKSKSNITVTCEPCNKEYSTMANLRRHMTTTHSKLRKSRHDRVRNCRICFENFNKPTIRLKHEQTAHLNTITNMQQCSECDYVHKSFESVIIHRLTHDDFFCSICGDNKKSYRKWRQHIQRHRRTQKPTDGLGNCVICDKSFEFRKDLILHERKNHKNPATKCYKCNQCNFETSQRRLIRDHIIEHTGRMPYICDVCGCGNSSQLLLQNHIKREHINKPKYQCNICQRVCHQKSALDRHLLVHQPDERPFKCNFCDKTYRDATDLRRHKRSHGTEIPKLACEKCDKRFYEPKQLRNHQRVYRHY